MEATKLADEGSCRLSTVIGSAHLDPGPIALSAGGISNLVH